MAYTFLTSKHGESLSIINDGKLVFKPDPRMAMDAVALTSQPLRAGEAFEVLLEAVLPIDHGGLEIGVTSNHPSELTIPCTMTDCKIGVTYMLSHRRVVKNGKIIHAVDRSDSNMDFKVGDVIAVKLGSLGFVQFLCNNRCLASIPLEEDCPMYGVVDLFGRAMQASINEGQAVNPQVHFDPTACTVISPGRNNEAAEIEDVNTSIGILVSMMVMNSPQDIDVVRSIFGGLRGCAKKSGEKRQEVIKELLAQNAPFVFTEYIRFLKLVENIPVHFELLKFIDELIGHSETFNIGIGEAGLLDICVEEVKGIDGVVKLMVEKVLEYQQILGVTVRLIDKARRVPENVVVLRRLDYVRAAKQSLQSGIKIEFVIMTIITCAAVMEDNEADLVRLTTEQCGQMLEWLKLAIEAQDHKHNGWHAKDFCECFTKLAASYHNLKEVVSSGGHVMFARLLKRGSSEEQEIAVRALHAHTCPQSYKKIAKVPKMLDLLGDVQESWTEDTKAIAADTLRQLMTYVDSHGISTAYVPDDPSEDIEDRMVQADKVVQSVVEERKLPANPSPRKDFSKELAALSVKEESANNECPYMRDCQQFLHSLRLQDAYFSHNDRCFCIACHTARKVDRYSQRGRPPHKYSLPVGWCRFGLSVPPKMKALKVHMKWHKAFHGTRQKYLAKILELGELIVPGKLVLGGEHLFERSVYMNGKLRTDSKKIFVSPTIEYAAHETYAPSERYVTEKGDVYDVRVAFEIFIAPGAYKVDKQTIGLREQIDPGFSNDEIEWTTVQQGSNVLYGLLVKVEKPA